MTTTTYTTSVSALVRVFFSVLLTGTSAFASPEFPAELREVAGMDCTPACTVCHTVNPGRARTAEQPFALSMTDKDLLGDDVLVADDVESLAAAYAALPDDHDSDRDGVPDKEELESEGASDPSVDGVGTPCAAEIKYGCGGQIARPTSAPWHLGPALLFSSGLLSLLFFRRRVLRASRR